MSIVIEKERSKATCRSCSSRIYHCNKSPELDDRACDEYIPPYYDHMIIDFEMDQCAVVEFSKWNYHTECIVKFNGKIEYSTYFQSGSDTHQIADTISKVIAEKCLQPESEMYLQVLEAFEELQKQEWYP